MAPGKFGLFKSRSREQSEQPSTENLLKSSQSTDFVKTPDSPVPSTSKGIIGDHSIVNMSVLSLDSDDEISSISNSRRGSQDSKEDLQSYQNLQNPSDVTSTCTLEDVDLNQGFYEPDVLADDDASTSYDANSLQYDESSIAPSEDMSIYCAMIKKPKKGRPKVQRLKDFDMWTASNFEVMQNLLYRSGTLDEQIKWEAIATARGLCTLTDCCTCPDCTRAKYLTGVTDGDGGLGTAPLFSAINGGCNDQAPNPYF